MASFGGLLPKTKNKWSKIKERAISWLVLFEVLIKALGCQKPPMTEAPYAPRYIQVMPNITALIVKKFLFFSKLSKELSQPNKKKSKPILTQNIDGVRQANTIC